MQWEEVRKRLLELLTRNQCNEIPDDEAGEELAHILTKQMIDLTKRVERIEKTLQEINK